MIRPTSTRLVPWRALRHPLWWTALVVLAVNDHLLKGAELLPTAVTGKLSDVAGLVVAPALLATLIGASRRATVTACHVLPVLALAALKLVPGAAEAVVALAAALGESWAIVTDPTDVLAAPAALVAWRVLLPRMAEAHRPRRDARALVLAAAGALACGATSRMPPQAPGLGEGQIVVQDWPGYRMHRVDATTGRELGRMQPEGAGWVDGPIVREGAVWIVADSAVREIDLATGATRWSHQARYSSIAEVDAHAVYAFVICGPDSCDDPRWVAIDRATKRERWSVRGEGLVPPVFGDGLVAIADGPRLIAREAASGAIAWTRTFAHDVRALAISGGVAWVVDEDAEAIVALDARTGEDRRRFAVEDGSRLGRRSWAVLPTSSAAGDCLWIAVDGVVQTLDVDGRAPGWTRPGDGVAATAGLVIVSESAGLNAHDVETGALRWRIAELGWHRAVVGDGVVAVREGDDLLGVYDVATGRRRFRFDFEAGVPTTAR